MDPTWHAVLQALVFLVLAFLGTSLTQALKNWLKVEDRVALILTGAVAAVFAIAELFLAQVIGLGDFALDKFPQTFTMIFALASIYYGWFKGSEGFLGKGGVLRQP
jgi:uncharacterized membrane protein